MKIRVVLTAFAVAGTLVGQAFSADSTAAPAASTNKSTSVAATAAAGGEVVARVNGADITRKDLDMAIQSYSYQMARQGRRVPPGQTAALQQNALDQLIGRQLILQEGSKQVPADIEKKVQEQVDQAKAGKGGDEEFKKTLADNGVTLEQFTREVRDGIIIRETLQSVVDKRVKISPEDARAFYDSNPEQFKQPELVRASHILIRCSPDATDEVKREKRAQIDAALSLVKGGSKFAEVAKKVSEDPGSAENGGDLGYFPRGRMVPEFDTAAFSMKTNEISGVITTQFGYHILQVTGRKPAQTMPFDEVKDKLTDYLKQKKGSDVTRTYVADLRSSAKVEVFLPAPAPSPSTLTVPSTPTVRTAPVQAPSPSK
ncbi:MAG: peptidylprolyl isomerase [Verrucomicrobiia bacterium]|jgi:peptidyl-prolyl cis-trans isomerase C